MGKIKKATKKFNKKQLHGELQRRKKIKGMKRKQQQMAARAEAQQQSGSDTDDAAHSSEDEFVDAPLAGGKHAPNEDAPSSDDEEELQDALQSDESDEEALGEDDGDVMAQLDALMSGSSGGDEDEDASNGDDDDTQGTQSAAQEAYKELQQSTKALRGKVASHRAQLEALRDTDPDFYEYLQQSDPQLLAFGDSGDDSDDDEGDDSEDEEDESEESEEEDSEQQQKGKKSRNVNKKQVKHKQATEDSDDSDEEEEEEEREEEDTHEEATPATAARVVRGKDVDVWCKAAQEGSFGAVRSLVKVFRVACHYGDTDESFEGTLQITSSATYNHVVMFMLKEADGMFRKLLGVDESASVKAVNKANRWRKVEPLCKSYLGNALHLLGQLADARMLAFILRRLRASAVFLGLFDRLTKVAIRQALGLFGSGQHGVRVQAVLLMRQVGAMHGRPALDMVLKGMYRTYSINAKFVNAAALPHLHFMAMSVAEVYSLDAAAAYQYAFGYIRQLAVLLRTALTMKSKDSYREVYCWQTINCLELWAKVLASNADQQPLRPLVYPVIQLLLGTARLVPTPTYLPLRVRCIRAVNRLAAAMQVYVPVGALCVEVLTWSQLGKPARGGGSGRECPDLLLQLRVSKGNLESTALQQEVVSQVLELLAEHLAQWSCHIAFPELSHPLVLQLRRFIKRTPVDKFKQQVRGLADAIERNAAWVAGRRSNVDFAPKDVSRVKQFLADEYEQQKAPLQQVASAMLRKAEARRAARASQEVEVRKRKAQDDDDDGDDGDDGDETEDEEEYGGSDQEGLGGLDGAAESDSEEEEEAEVQRKKQQMGKRVQGRGLVVEDGPMEDDRVELYELSEEEEEEEEARAVQQQNGHGMKKQQHKQGAKQRGKNGFHKQGKPAHKKHKH